MNCMIHYIWLRKTKNKSNHRRTICNDQWRHMRSSKWLIKVNVIDLNYVIVTWCKKWVMMTQHESIWVIISTCVPCVMLSASYRAPCWVTMSHDGLPWVMMSYFASAWLMVTHGDSLGFMVIHYDSCWVIMAHFWHRIRLRNSKRLRKLLWVILLTSYAIITWLRKDDVIIM